MASNLKLDSSSSSPDRATYGSQRSNHTNSSNFDRSGNNRDCHDGRLVLGTGSVGGAVNSPGFGVELPPLAQVLSLEPLTLGEQRIGRHLELKRAINAAVGSSAGEDPTLGNVQAKPLEAFAPEELKRVKNSVHEHTLRARERSRHLTEAITKLDRFRNSLHSRKRSRPESNVLCAPGTSSERCLASLAVGERCVASVHSMKSSSNAAPPHGTVADGTMQKSVDKNKRVVPNKRVRTSVADTRLLLDRVTPTVAEIVKTDVRTASVNPQRPSVLTERERDVSRSLVLSVDEKERVIAPSEGWEKTKMKGRRSGVISKTESLAANNNGGPEHDREHKWNGQQHRMIVEGRSRPSEGHGFRSGPVHGVTSVHKAESSVQLNGLSVRGVSKAELENAPASGDRPERLSVPDRERTVSKSGVKPPPIRDESHVGSPAVITKIKAARAPRSNAGGSSSHLARTSSFVDTRERSVPPAKAQVQTQSQVLSGSTNRKRQAPSRSSSPPAQWVGQRPQKMARVARRVTVLPGSALARDEPSVAGEVSVTRDCVGTISGARPNSGIASGSGFARRVSGLSTHSQPSVKAKPERVTTSVVLSESDESADNGEKIKEKVKKQEVEQKSMLPSQKMACLVPAKKTRVVTKEDGGDGVRRQGRSGRGAVTLRTNVMNPVEKVELSANAKQLGNVRFGPEKLDRISCLPMKKDTVDYKLITRPRRLVGNDISEISGESDDDHEEFANAVRIAVSASEKACSSGFWKEMEPYFTFLTAADLLYIQQQAQDLKEDDPALQIPACGNQYGKLELKQNSPPVSPFADTCTGRSMSLANCCSENDSFVTKLFHNLKDKHEATKGGRKGVSGGWLEKILPLSQRLLAALINESDPDEGMWCGENSQDDSAQGLKDDSPIHSSMSVGERLDDDSDGEIGRCEVERWSSVGIETCEDEVLLPNGYYSRSAPTQPHDELGTEDEGILASVEADPMSSAGHVEMGSGDVILAGNGISGRDNERSVQLLGSMAGMTAWEIQYQRMTIDDRIVLELQSIGLLPEPVQPDHNQREDDEISEELRKIQRLLRDQVQSNKEQVIALEKTIWTKKESEERDRERFALEKFVEMAYSRRMGSRSSAGGKSAGKGAKTAGLAFAKRVLARIRAFESGHSCFDGALRDLLFCVAPKESESSIAFSVGLDGVTPISFSEVAPGSNATLQLPKAPALLSGEVSGVRSIVRRTDVKPEKDIPEVRQQHVLPLVDHGQGKEEGWLSRVKEKEVLIEDVVGVSGMHDATALGANLMGGMKGKRSERERDDKGHGKESHIRSDSAKGAQQAVGNAKSERKTKTKPRQKTAPLSKAVNLLLAKPTAGPAKDHTMNALSSQQYVGLSKFKEDCVVVNPLANQSMVPDADDVTDLSNIPIPGIEDLGVSDLSGQGQDLGSWLQDFEEDVQLNQDGNCLMGLEVPMDDLSDLGLMM